MTTCSMIIYMEILSALNVFQKELKTDTIRYISSDIGHVMMGNWSHFLPSDHNVPSFLIYLSGIRFKLSFAFYTIRPRPTLQRINAFVMLFRLL